MPAPRAAASTTAAPAAWRRAVAVVPPGLWVFADQGIVSLANFVAPILVGRTAGQEQLGFFALGFSIYLFVLGLARALIWTAYTRQAPRLDPARQAACAGSATVHLGLFLAASTPLLLLMAVGAQGLGASDYALLLAVTAPAIAAMLLREHVRRLGLARFAFLEVCAFDTLVAAAQVLLLFWLASRGRLTAASAFGALAATSLLAVPWLLARRDAWTIRWADVGPDWRENWAISKWLTCGATAVLLGKEGYNWLLSAVASIAELGRLGAARIVVQVTNPLVIGASNYLGPTSAKVLQEQGAAGLWRYTLRTSAIMLASIASFVAVAAVVGLPLIRLAFRDAAAGVTQLLVVTFTAGVLSEALLIPIEFAMVNLGRTRLMFQTALARLAINGTLGFGLVGVFGAEAIGVGMLLGSLVALAWQWTVFARETRRA